jgi:hypothetical protein
MSGTYPVTPKVQQAALQSLQPTRVSFGQNLKRQSRTRGAQRWGIKFTYPQMMRSEFAPLHAFLLSQRGQADTFTTLLPGHTTPRGSWLGSPIVNGSSQSGRTINLRGLTASQSGVAKAGDLIKFPSHSKVYMVTADANSDSSGTASISIEPALIATPIDGEAPVTTNVPFNVALASDTLDANISPGVLYGMEVNLVEVW